ncbi:MAG: hypothetical protein ACSLEL_04010 [Candidatus Malihini olakiniferum]
MWLYGSISGTMALAYVIAQCIFGTFFSAPFLFIVPTNATTMLLKIPYTSDIFHRNGGARLSVESSHRNYRYCCFSL